MSWMPRELEQGMLYRAERAGLIFKDPSRRRVSRQLLRAAELVDRGQDDFCCEAIISACNDQRVCGCSESLDVFQQLFEPWPVDRGASGAEFWNEEPTLERQELRVLALLFASREVLR